MDALLREQAQQEMALLRDELDSQRTACDEGLKREAALRHELDASDARVAALQADVSAAREAMKELEQNRVLDARLRSESADTTGATRVAALRAQLSACEEACASKITQSTAALEMEVEQLRERSAVHEGTAQAATNEAHEAALRAQTAEARADQLQRTVDSLQQELSTALDESTSARTAANAAERGEQAAKAEASLQKELLERRAVDAEERLHAAPAEKDAAVALLRRAYRELTERLHERTTGIVQREVRLRMVAEERARLRALKPED